MRNVFLLCAVAIAGPAIGQTAPTPAPSATPAPAATAAPQVRVGAAIVDSSGAEVGTVDQVAGDVVTVNTGTNKVGVPLGNFAAGPNGLVLGNTKAQLDAAAAQVAAQTQAQVKTRLVPGAEVRGTGGIVLGTVKSADGESATITSKQGDVRLPLTGLAVGPNGLVAGLTAAQFEAAVAAAKGQ